jgi:hypothetical protein
MQHDLLDAITLPSSPRAERRISPVSKGHFSGHLIVGDGAGEAMEVESHLEMNVALVLSTRSDVAELENQVPFRWQTGGTWRTHYFDFRVNKLDGSRTAIMVKPSKKLACPRFQAEAREIARHVTSDVADHVTIMTERDVDPVELHNAQFLHGLRESDPEADSAARRVMARVVGAIPVREIVAAVGREGRGFRAVGRLLRNGELALVNKERISKDALVTRRAA